MSSSDKTTSTTGTNAPSTLQAAVEGAAGLVQSALGSLTGSTGDKVEGEHKKSDARAEHDASHTTAHLGNVSASSSGAVTKDNSARTEGQYDQTVGAAKQAIGGVFSNDLAAAGREQVHQGEGKQAQGQVSDLTKGVADRVAGTVGSATAGLTGNTLAKEDYSKQHAEGKTRFHGVQGELHDQGQATANAKTSSSGGV